MNYRRIAISTLAVAALGLAACSDDATEPGDTIEVTPTVQQTVDEAPAAEPTADDTVVTDDATMNEQSPPAEQTPPAEQSPPAEQVPPAAPDAGQMTALGQVTQAIQLAEQEANGTAYEIDDEDDNRAWEIYVLQADGSSVEVTVDAEGLNVIGTEPESTDDLPELPQTTLVDAISAAMAQSPGILDDAELDTEDGVVVWKVTIDQTAQGDDIEYYLDAATLQVIKTD